MCLLSDLKYIWMQSKALLVLAFRNIMNTYSSAALESCFPYKLMTWCTNWYCSQVWIIPPLKRKEKKGRETAALLHANIWGNGTSNMKLMLHTKGLSQNFPKWVKSTRWLQPAGSLTSSFILKASATQGTEGSQNRHGLYLHFSWQRPSSSKVHSYYRSTILQAPL